MGHYFVAKKRGYKLDSFFIASYGFCLNYKQRTFETSDEFWVAIAGPFCSLSLSLFLSALWWIFPITYSFTSELAFQSLSLGLFNLIPCYPLDGGRVLCSILSNKIERKKAVTIVIKLNYFFSFILVCLFILSIFYNFNPTFILASIFLAVGNIDFQNEGKYNPIFLIEKSLKNFSKPSFFYIDEKASLSEILRKIEGNKFTIFVVNFKNGKTNIIDENLIKKMVMQYPINISIGEIIKE